MFQDTSPTTRSEPDPRTPRKLRACMGTGDNVTKSMTPQKRKVNLFSSSPPLSRSDSPEWASTPLTPSHYGLSSLQQRLRRTCDSESEGHSIPSSPPERYTSCTHDRSVAKYEAETPSKRVKREERILDDQACHDTRTRNPIPVNPRMVRKGGVNSSTASLEQLLSQLSTEPRPSRTTQPLPDSHVPSNAASSGDEDPFTGTSALCSSSHVSPDTSLPDVDQHTGQDEENSQALEGNDITAENAQSILLPQACVFAANLPRSESDETITAALVKAFSAFGQCWVKVLRTRNDQMPYAFVQYKTSEEAHAAVELGRGADILGRPCRTEVARAHRAVYVSRRDGLCPTRLEILNLLTPFGEIEAIVFPSETDMSMHDLQPGGWARFCIFGDCKDAIQQLQADPTYYVRQAKELTPKNQLFQNIGHHGHPRNNFKRLQTIRICWLPTDIIENQIRERFQTHGRIEHLDMRARYPGPGPNVEVLITYAGWRNAENAVNAEDNLSIVRDGHKRRVMVNYTSLDSLQTTSAHHVNFQVHPSVGPGPLNQHPPMGPFGVYPNGTWVPAAPMSNIYWPNNANLPQQIHPAATGMGGPLQMPFFGMPVQFWPGPMPAEFNAAPPNFQIAHFKAEDDAFRVAVKNEPPVEQPSVFPSNENVTTGPIY